VVAFPVGDQRVVMGRQGCVEGGGFVAGEPDPVAAAVVVGGLGDLALRFGAGCECDGGAQLVDRRGLRQEGVVGVGAVGGAFGDGAVPT
jgi:hypothetical protein